MTLIKKALIFLVGLMDRGYGFNSVIIIYLYLFISFLQILVKKLPTSRIEIDKMNAIRTIVKNSNRMIELKERELELKEYELKLKEKELELMNENNLKEN